MNVNFEISKLKREFAAFDLDIHNELDRIDWILNQILEHLFPADISEEE